MMADNNTTKSPPSLPPINSKVGNTASGNDEAASKVTPTNKTNDEKVKNTQSIKKFVYSKKEIATLNPDATEFVDIKEWSKLGITIDRERIRVEQSSVNELEARAKSLFNEHDDNGNKAHELQEEANKIKKSFKERLSKYNNAVHVIQIAKMAMDYYTLIPDYMNAGIWRDILHAAQAIAPDYNIKPKPKLTAKSLTATSSTTKTVSTNPTRCILDLTDDNGVSNTAAAITKSRTVDKPIMIKVPGGGEKELDSVLDKPKLHKCGEASESKKRNGSYMGKVIKESNQGDSSNKRPKNGCTQREYEKLLGTPYGPRTNSNGDVCQGKDRRDHYIKWDTDLMAMVCVVCKGTQITKKNMVQHIIGPTHLNNVTKEDKKQANRERLIPQLHDAARKFKIVGQSMSGELKTYQLEALEEMCMANQTAHSFGEMAPFIDRNSSAGLYIGNTVDLVERWKHILYDILVKRNQGLVSFTNCFPEFGTISDGTPCCANAEALRVVKVTKQGRIISPLVTFQLYEKSPNGREHANHLITSVMHESDGPALSPDDWVVATQDGCSTNGAAIDHIHTTTLYNPNKNTCCSHTCCLSGKSFVTPNLKIFRSKWNICIRYKGKLIDRYRNFFGESPLKSGGIRWWIEFEQSSQLSDHGIVKVINEVVHWGLANNASSQSCQTLLNEVTDGNHVQLALALVENAAVVNGGRIFAIMTYIFEGDDPLILSGYRGFEQLDKAVGYGDEDAVIELPLVAEVAPSAIALLSQARVPIQKRVDDGRTLLEEKEQQLVAMEQVLAQLTSNRSRAGAGARSSSRATTAQTYTGGNVTNVQDAAKTKKDAESSVKRATNEVKAAKKALAESEKELAEWNGKNGGYLTNEGLLAYARQCIEPGHTKYKEQFIKSSGRCTMLRKGALACKIFDPFVLKNLPVSALELLVDSLACFERIEGQPYFSQQFLMLMKTEIPKAKEHAEKPFDWNSIEDSDRYRDRKNRREMKKELAKIRNEVEDGDDPECEYEPYEQSDEAGHRREPDQSDDWKDDLGEYGRRIWEWWLLRWLHVKDFVYFGEAIRKVVLWKLSSAQVERDFSQFVAIRNACGSNLKKPMLQNRMYLRCNKRDYEDAKALGALLLELDDEMEE